MHLSPLLILAPVVLARDQFEASLTADSCAWNPLRDASLLSCQANLLPQIDRDSVQYQHSNASKKATKPAQWEGPFHCYRDDLCIYTHRSFADGIVVITTSPNLARVKLIASQPHIDDHTDPAAASPPLYKPAPVPGKGIGLVATHPIAQGEPIMARLPTVLVHRRFVEDTPPADQSRLLQLAVDKLPAARRRAFRKQAAQAGGDALVSIVFTNSFQVNLGGEDGEGHHFGNFPEISRLNHDCRPNLAWRITTNLTHQTNAVRPIAAGEELSISYIDLFLPQAQRRAQLQRTWGFRCSCAACTGHRRLREDLGHHDQDAVAASDARVRELAAVEAELENLQSKAASPALVDRLMELYAAERLEAKSAGGLTVAAMNYAMFGEEKKARQTASRAARAIVAEYGEGAADAAVMEELAKSPRRHWSWGKRNRSLKLG